MRDESDIVPEKMRVEKKYIIRFVSASVLFFLCIVSILYGMLRFLWLTHPKKVSGYNERAMFQTGKLVEVEYDYAYPLYSFWQKSLLVPKGRGAVTLVKLHDREEFVLVVNGLFRTMCHTKAETEEFVLQKSASLVGTVGKIKSEWADDLKEIMEKGERKDGEKIPNKPYNTNISYCIYFKETPENDFDSFMSSFFCQDVITSLVMIFLWLPAYLKYKKEKRLVRYFQNKERCEQREKKKLYDME